jgi:hypothetical protein
MQNWRIRDEAAQGRRQPQARMHEVNMRNGQEPEIELPKRLVFLAMPLKTSMDS